MAGKLPTRRQQINHSNRDMIPNATDGVELEDMELKSNANVDKEGIKVPPIPLKKVIGRPGRIRRRKKSPLSKLTSVLFGEDAKQVIDYILHDVLIPAAKSTITDMVTGGIERLVYGDEGARSSRLRRDKGQSVVSYSSFYKDRDRQTQRPKRRGRTIDDLIFDKREEADRILDNLLAILEEYECVSVADLYDAVGITSNDFTIQNYGWTNLRDASVDRIRGGFLLNLPETEALS